MGFYGILDVDGFDTFLPTRNDILETGGGFINDGNIGFRCGHPMVKFMAIKDWVHIQLMTGIAGIVRIVDGFEWIGT